MAAVPTEICRDGGRGRRICQAAAFRILAAATLAFFQIARHGSGTRVGAKNKAACANCGHTPSLRGPTFLPAASQRALPTRPANRARVTAGRAERACPA